MNTQSEGWEGLEQCCRWLMEPKWQAVYGKTHAAPREAADQQLREGMDAIRATEGGCPCLARDREECE